MGNGIEITGNGARAAALRLPRAFSADLWRRLAPAGVIAAGVGVPLVVALSTGAFGIPRIDDWSYYRADASLLHTGGIHLVGLGPMTLVGHLIWGLPFLAVLGTSIAAVHWAGTVASVIALWSAYVLFRRFVPKPFALFGAAVLAAAPIFAGLATSFMTDTTGLSASLACLALGASALDREGRARTRWLAASLAVGVLGFAIREPAIAAPLAVLAGYAVTLRREGRSIVPIGATLAGLLGLCAALWVWRQGLPHSQSGGVSGGRGVTSASVAATKFSGLFFVMAFAVLPALVLGRRALRSLMRRPVIAAVAGVTLLIGLERLVSRGVDSRFGVFLGGGDDFTRHPLGTPTGHLPAIVPAAVWAVVLAAAVVAGACLAALLVDQGASAGRQVARHRLDAFSATTWIVVVFGLISAALVFARALSGENLFDRYLLPVVPAVLLLVLFHASRAAGPRPAWRAGGAALAVVAALAVIFVTDLSSGHAARWHAGERLVAAGYPASDVDAGFEWLGLHHPGPLGSGGLANSPWRGPRELQPKFTRSGNCGIVASQPLDRPGLRLLRRESYRYGLGSRHETLLIYRNEASCIAGGTP